MALVRSALGAVLVAWAAPATAQVDCSTLTGTYCDASSCTLPKLQVDSPCVVNFGSRTLALTGTIRIPAAGILSFTATHIQVSAPIRGGDGASLTLTATPGSISVDQRVNVYGGHITLDGASGVVAFVPVKARTRPGGAPGSLTVESGGLIQFTRPIRLNGKRESANGGNVTLHAAGDVRIDDIDVSGLHAGTIDITSDASHVDCWDDICRVRARGGIAGAGSIRMNGRFVVFNLLKLQADGAGGEVRMRASLQLSINADVDVRGGGGIFEAASANLLGVHGTYRAAPGGCIALDAPTIDTTGATFDTTPVTDCPGSPGGAFVD